MQVSVQRSSSEEDGGGEETANVAAEGNVGAVKRGLVSGMMKKHLVEAVVPLLIELKRQMEAEHNPILRDCGSACVCF